MSRPLSSHTLCVHCLRALRSQSGFAVARPTGAPNARLPSASSVYPPSRSTAASLRPFASYPNVRTAAYATSPRSIRIPTQPARTPPPPVLARPALRPLTRRQPQPQPQTPNTHTRSLTTTTTSTPTTTPSPPQPPPPENPTTQTLANPRYDSTTGSEMLLTISPRAAKRLTHLMHTESNPALALRITVTSGGCHGFQYLMSLTSLPTSTSTAEHTEHNIEEKEEETENEDTILTDATTGAKIILDEPSLELLQGSTVDFTQELIGSQFKVVGNPAASSSCGCGTSFEIK